MKPDTFLLGDKVIQQYKDAVIIDTDGVIQVVTPSTGTRFIIDLDDSKIGGNRRSAGMNYSQQIEAAKKYIDLTR